MKAGKCCNTCRNLSLDDGRRCYECGRGHYSVIHDPNEFGVDCSDYDMDNVESFQFEDNAISYVAGQMACDFREQEKEENE